MKTTKRLAAMSVIAAIGTFAGAIHAQSQTAVYGYVVINVIGGFRTAVGVNTGASATCKGFVVATPTNASSPTLSALNVAALFGSAVQTSSTPATINSAGTNFTCSIVVPYQLNNVSAANQQLVIGFSAEATDPPVFNGIAFTGGSHPGKTKQLVGTIPVPSSSGTTQTYNVQVYL